MLRGWFWPNLLDVWESMVLIICTKNESNLTNRYWDMVPDGRTDGMDGRTDRRTDDTKTISLRLCRGIKSWCLRWCTIDWSLVWPKIIIFFSINQKHIFWVLIETKINLYHAKVFDLKMLSAHYACCIKFRSKHCELWSGSILFAIQANKST